MKWFTFYFYLMTSVSLFANEAIDFKSESFKDEMVKSIEDKLFQASSPKDATKRIEDLFKKTFFDRSQFPEIEKKIMYEVSIQLPIAVQGLKAMNIIDNEDGINPPSLSILSDYGLQYGLSDVLDQGLLLEEALSQSSTDLANITTLLLNVKDPKLRASVLESFGEFPNLPHHYWSDVFDQMMKENVIDSYLLETIFKKNFERVLESGKERFDGLISKLIEMEQINPDMIKPSIACQIGKTIEENESSLNKDYSEIFIQFLEASLYSAEVLDSKCGDDSLITLLKDLQAKKVIDFSNSFIYEWLSGVQAGCGEKNVTINLGQGCEWSYVVSKLQNNSRFAKALATLQGRKEAFTHLGQFPSEGCDIEFYERIIRNNDSYITSDIGLIIKKSKSNHRELTKEERENLLKLLNKLSK